MSSGIRFPVSLPVPLRDSYAESFEEIHRATEMEVGVSRRRARMRKAPRRFDIALSLSQAEFTVFDDWWHETILGGARSFDIQLLDSDDIDPLVWYTVWIVDGKYSLNVTQSFDYEVSFTVRTASEPFTDRPVGTDSLQGYASVGIRSAKLDLSVYTPVRGLANVGLTSATVKLNLQPMRGAANFGVVARARF